MDIAAILTAIAALLTAVGHAYNCERRIRELERARDDARRELKRLAGDLGAFEKALEESGRFKVPPIKLL